MSGSRKGGRTVGRPSHNRRKRPAKARGRGRLQTFVANRTLSGAATTSIRGSAMHDLIAARPLMGAKFENRRMVYYDDNMELKESSGLLQTHFFRANDAYDPDAETGGHQPIGFDQAMLNFEQFLVPHAKITVRFISNSPAAICVGVFLSPDTTPPGTNGDLMENGDLKSTLLYGASTSTFGGASNTVKTVSLTCDNAKYFSQRGLVGYQSNSVFSGTAASSPSEMNYFGIFAFCMTGAVAYSVVYDVTLSYDVIFWEPRKVSQSLSAEVLRATIEGEQRLLQPSHEEKVLEVARRVRSNKHSTVKDFVNEMKSQGLWQDQKTYRDRRNQSYRKTRLSSSMPRLGPIAEQARQQSLEEPHQHRGYTDVTLDDYYAMMERDGIPSARRPPSPDPTGEKTLADLIARWPKLDTTAPAEETTN